MSVQQPSSVTQMRLLQLVSPSLPVGSFTYSQGLEWAFETGWVIDAGTLETWLDDLLQTTIAGTDLPLLARLHAATVDHDVDRFSAVAAEVLAWRETAELRAEERQKGRALLAVLDALEGEVPPPWRDAMASCYLAGFAWAAAHWSATPAATAESYGYGWLENQVIAAVKLVPLGQTAGQKVLHRLAGRIPCLVETALALDDDRVGVSATALAIASSRHETQYTRLYRS